jgi:hypothetical protein
VNARRSRKGRRTGLDSERRLEPAGSPPTFKLTPPCYLENGGTLEHAQQIAAHESPRTTKLYDRTNDQITLDEIERIAI